MRVAALLALIAACGNDGGGVIPADAGPIDAPLFDAALGIDCKTVFCPPPEMCCAEQLVPPQFTQFCLEPDEADICMGNRYFCDGPEDCGEGQVCCTDSDSSDVACTDLATCQAQGTVVCHVDRHCPFPLRCQSTLLQIIRACQ